MKTTSLLTFAAIWLWCSLVPDLLQLPGALIVGAVGGICYYVNWRVRNEAA